MQLAFPDELIDRPGLNNEMYVNWGRFLPRRLYKSE